MPRVGLADLECLADVPEGVVEGLTEYVDGAFDRGEPFEEEPDGERELLAALGPQLWVDGRRVGPRKPFADTDLSARPSGGRCVEGNARRDGDEESDAIADVRPVGALPAKPYVLDDVLGVRYSAEHLVGDREQSAADVLEACNRLVQTGAWPVGRRTARAPTHPADHRGNR